MIVQLGTMGMFIIDTFKFLDPKTDRDLGDKGLKEQIGGGGCYFAIGARMWLPPRSIQMIIDQGPDFSSENLVALHKFGPMWHFRKRDGVTTRAINIYKGEHRGFDYLTPKIRLEPSDLLECSPTNELPKWIHLICSPARALETLANIEKITKDLPKLIYEPIPDSCIFANLEECFRVIPSLEVFSPNHEEAASLLGLTQEWESVLKTDDKTILKWIEEKLASGFVKILPKEAKLSIICIRCGPWGSIIGRGRGEWQRVPAWHQNADKIVDVTGAGNSFLGGLAAGLIATEDEKMDEKERLREAAMRGSVSASLIIEQLGLPSFQAQDEQELWNGAPVSSRLDTLRSRTVA